MMRLYMYGSRDQAKDLLFLKHRIDASQAIFTSVQFVTVQEAADVEGGWHPAPLNELYPDAPHVGDVLQIRSCRDDEEGDDAEAPRDMYWRIVVRRYHGATHDCQSVQGLIQCLVEPVDGPWGWKTARASEGELSLCAEYRRRIENSYARHVNAGGVNMPSDRYSGVELAIADDLRQMLELEAPGQADEDRVGLLEQLARETQLYRNYDPDDQRAHEVDLRIEKLLKKLGL